MKLQKFLITLLVLLIVISPVNYTIAKESNSSVRPDVNQAMRYAPLVSKMLKRSKNSYGVMLYQTLSRFSDIGYHEPFMIALMAKVSGGRKNLMNNNYVGLYQILGFRPFAQFTYPSGYKVDNRKYLVRPKRNIRLAILLADKIFEDIWKPEIFMHINLIKIAKRFYCTPNHYSEIIYDCENGQSWAEDWYYNYLPLAHSKWYSQ